MAVATSRERMIAGVAAAAVALGVAQLVGIPFGARADARTGVGSVAVDLTPGPIKEWAIQTLGSLDKVFLAVVVLVVIATIAAIAGTLETRRRPLGSAAIAAAGVLGCVAVLSRPGATALDTIPTVAGAACGVAALRLLTRRFRPGPGDPEDRADHDEPDAGRRRLIVFGLLGFGVVSGVVVRSSRGWCTRWPLSATPSHFPDRAHRRPRYLPRCNRKALRYRALSPPAPSFTGWTPHSSSPNSATATGACTSTAWWTAKRPTASTTSPASTWSKR